MKRMPTLTAAALAAALTVSLLTPTAATAAPERPAAVAPVETSVTELDEALAGYKDAVTAAKAALTRADGRGGAKRTALRTALTEAAAYVKDAPTVSGVKKHTRIIQKATGNLSLVLDNIDIAAVPLAKQVTQAKKLLDEAGSRKSTYVSTLKKELRAARALLKDPKITYARADKALDRMNEANYAVYRENEEMVKAVKWAKKELKRGKSWLKKVKGKAPTKELRHYIDKVTKALASKKTNPIQLNKLNGELDFRSFLAKKHLKQYKNNRKQLKGWTRPYRLLIDKHAYGSTRLLHDARAACGSIACADEGTIWISKAILNYSPGDRTYVIHHELGHFKQFAVGMGKLKKNKTFKKLFGRDIERMADCMARAMGHPGYSMPCSSAQLKFSKQVWNGKLP